MFDLLILDVKASIGFAKMQLGVTLASGIVLYAVSPQASTTLLFMLSFAAITLLPLVLSLITVYASTKIQSTEVIAATPRGLKRQIILQFLYGFLWGVIGSSVFYAFLASRELWPRNAGLVTLLHFLLGVAILSLIGLVGVFISGYSRGGAVSAIIGWIVLSFMVDPFSKSILLARVLPFVVVIICLVLVVRKVEEGRLLLVSNE